MLWWMHFVRPWTWRSLGTKCICISPFGPARAVVTALLFRTRPLVRFPCRFIRRTSGTLLLDWCVALEFETPVMRVCVQDVNASSSMLQSAFWARVAVECWVCHHPDPISELRLRAPLRRCVGCGGTSSGRTSVTLAQHSAQLHTTPGAVCAHRTIRLCYINCFLHVLHRVWLEYLDRARLPGKSLSSMLCDAVPYVCLSRRQAVVVFDNVGSGFVIGIKANNVGGVTRLRKGTTINCFQLRYRGGWYTAVGKVCAANGASVCRLANCALNSIMGKPHVHAT